MLPRDIVDTEPAGGDVYIMFLGSFEKYYDDMEEDHGGFSPPIHRATFRSGA